ncbi:MAG: DUF5696 domain-containing protein [Lachnospiraceae bacterium]
METKFRKQLFCRLCSLFLAFLLCVTGLSGTAATAFAEEETVSLKDGDIPSDYKPVTESDSYRLYVKEDTMSILLENKQSGKVLYSTLMDWDDTKGNNKTWRAYMQSGIVISAIKGITDNTQVDLVSAKNTISYKYHDNGFTATIFFTKYEFGLSVEVSLTGDELLVRVPEESIIEKSSNMYIGTISLFPMMGYTYLDAKEGYMLIPDGNGALIYLDDKDGRYSAGFSQMIYGKDAGFTDSTTEELLWGKYKTVVDPEKVLAPVFGMIHSDDRLGYLAIVEEGDLRASIEAHPNGVMVDYNRCFAKFRLRQVYVQPLNNSNSGTMQKVENDRSHSNLAVRYLLVSGDAADYSGMAVAYREYLLDNGLVTVKDTDYKTRVDFLGTDREEFLIFTRAVTMTTTDQIAEIYEDLQENGVSSLLTVYKGWQKGGLYNLPITKYKADSKIGGTNALTELIAESAKKGYDIYLYNNALLSNPAESNTTFTAVKKINKRTLEINTRGYVYQYFNYVLPAKMDSMLDKFVAAYTKKGVNNLALAGITNNLYSYSYSGTFYNRFDCAQSYINMITDVAADTNLILESPFMYLWNQTGAFLDMPLGSSKYMYEDEEVPFLSIVLKGILPMYSDYVNFEANKQEFRLQMIEAGVYPSFYLTAEDSSDLIYTNSAGLYSTKYDTYRDTVMEYDAEFRELAKITADAFILRHDKLTDGVNKVTYDNGVIIYINYNDYDITAEGVLLPAMSAKVVK